MSSALPYIQWLRVLSVLVLLLLLFKTLSRWYSQGVSPDVKSVDLEEYVICNRSNFPPDWILNRSFKTHSYTSRGLQVQYIDLLAVGRRHPTMKFLEIGTGLGHLIIELQSNFPRSVCHGTNYIGQYWGTGFPQSSTPLDLIAVAAYYNVSLRCDARGVPRLPTIFSMNGVENDAFDLYLPRHFYDVVTSLHALNNKFPAKYTPLIISRVLRILKPLRSFAHLHFSSVNVASPEYSKLCNNSPQLLRFRVIEFQQQKEFVIVYSHRKHGFCAVFVVWARGVLPAQFEIWKDVRERNLTDEEYLGSSPKKNLDDWNRIQLMLTHLDVWCTNLSSLVPLLKS